MKKSFTSAVFAALFTMLLLTGCDKQTEDGSSIEVYTLDIEVDNYSAKVYFSIYTVDGGGVSSVGVCWADSEKPTVNDNKTDEGPVTGTHFSKITGLEVETKYYVRAYAVAGDKTYYGEEKTIFIKDEAIECQAGQLEEIITRMGLMETESLSLSGTIDQRDFVFMRDKMFKLLNVDLLRTTIASYGEYPANEIPEGAFYYYYENREDYPYNREYIKSFVFPKGVTSIGKEAFYGTYFNELSLPAGLKRIGNSSFENCSMLVGDLLLPENLEYIGDSAFKDCFCLNGILVIPSGLKYIGDSAFYGCSRLRGNLVLPEELEYLGESAFYSCGGLTGDLIIPVGVKEIKTGTFQRCKFEGVLILPAGLEAMGRNAFLGCPFERINIYREIPIAYTRSMLSSETPIYVPKNSVALYEAADGWKDHPIYALED